MWPGEQCLKRRDVVEDSEKRKGDKKYELTQRDVAMVWPVVERRNVFEYRHRAVDGVLVAPAEKIVPIIIAVCVAEHAKVLLVSSTHIITAVVTTTTHQPSAFQASSCHDAAAPNGLGTSWSGRMGWACIREQL